MVPPLLGQFLKTIHPLVLELAMKEMGRDDAKKLYTVRNYRKKVVKLGATEESEEGEGDQLASDLICSRPLFLVMSSKMANSRKNREGKRTFSVILRSRGREESKESNRIRP